MNWSAAVPHEPGIWLHSRPGHNAAVGVLFITQGEIDTGVFNDLGGIWYGPIPMPGVKA